MKIVMFTNTYLPHVGGVAHSVHSLECACRARGHEVRVIAPEFEGAEPSPHVLRVPAIRNFNNSGFSVRLPIPNLISDFMEDFSPDIIHSHHPFLLGDAALREARKARKPIIFTHHTLYERYTHYLLEDSPGLERAAVRISSAYCNLCDLIIAPSQSVADLLVEREVIQPVEVLPTGIDTRIFAAGDGRRCREKFHIPVETRLLGHVGRLAEEKNLLFLAESVAAALTRLPDSCFLLIGEGDALPSMLELLAPHVADGRVFHPGKQSGVDLADAYAAIDCFVFASQTETQGMVLAEAMAAATPVVALDGPGVREIMRDGENGLLLGGDASKDEFADAMVRMLESPEMLELCSKGAVRTAARYDTNPCVETMIRLYGDLIVRDRSINEDEWLGWDRMVTGIELEWDLLSAKVSAATAAVIEPPATEAALD